MLALELVGAGWAIHEGLRLRQVALALRQETRTDSHALDGLSVTHPDLARLEALRSHAQAAGVETQQLLAAGRRWRWLLAPAERWPAAGLEVRQGLAALAAAHAGSALAATLLDTAPKLLPASPNAAHPSQVLLELRAAQPELADALLDSASLDRSLTQVRGGRLFHLAQPFLPLEQSALPLAQQVLRGALLAPAALGIDGPVSYLLVAQNPSDLRPTGGFMGSWGVITVNQGSITRLDYRGYAQWEDVSDRRRGWPLQPAPVQRYLHHCCIAMQDANWYADFPTTALVLQQFFQADQPTHPAGVIAVDPAVVLALLRLTGPVELSAPKQTVTADNFVELATYYEGNGPTQPPPNVGVNKEFLVAVAEALAGRLAQSPQLHLTSLAQAMLPLLAEKHVLIAFNNSDLAALTHDRGWDGAVTTPAGDYLLLDEMSMSDNKVDEDIARAVTDQVQVTADGGADVTLQITWRNNYPRPQEPDAGLGAGIPPTTAFRDYFRLYLPPGSTPRGLAGVDDVWPATSESGHTVIPGFVSIPQAGSRTVTVQYHVPAAVLPGGSGQQYVLHMQVQPGTPALQFHVRILGPTGAVVGDTSSSLTYDQSWRFPVTGAAVHALVPSAPWDQSCVALKLVAGLLGPYSKQPASVPTYCVVPSPRS